MRLNHEVARNLNTHHNTVNKQCASASSRVVREGSDTRVASLANASIQAFRHALADASSPSSMHIATQRKALRGAGFGEDARCDTQMSRACMRDAARGDGRGIEGAMRRPREATKKTRRFRIAQAGLRKIARTLRASSGAVDEKNRPPEGGRSNVRHRARRRLSDPRPRSARRSRPGRAVRPAATRRRSATRTASRRHRHRR